MDSGLYLQHEGLEQAGRTSFRSAESAEEVQRTVNRVEANSSSYGGATAFVNALNNARTRHARGAGQAAENRDNMGDGDHWAADYSVGMEEDAAAQIQFVADLNVANGM